MKNVLEKKKKLSIEDQFEARYFWQRAHKRRHVDKVISNQRRYLGNAEHIGETQTLVPGRGSGLEATKTSFFNTWDDILDQTISGDGIVLLSIALT